MQLNQKQEDALSKGLIDVGKITLAGLVVGPLIQREPFNLAVLAVGMIVTVLCFVLGIAILKT